MKKIRKGDLFVTSFSVILFAIWMIPLYYLLVTTFKSTKEASASPLGLPLIPKLTNYISAFEKMDYMNSLLNNLMILIGTLALLIPIALLAAYAISRSRSKLIKILSQILFAGLIIPFQITIIPLYRLINGMNLMNTFPGITLVNVFCIHLVFSIFLFRGFINTIPIEIEKAGQIDGAGYYRIFFQIVFPLLKPIIATVVILDSLAVWNDFMTPLLFLQDPRKAVLLQQVYKNIGPFATDWATLFPMLILAVLPLILLFLFFQKYIIGGVVAGSLKG